MTPSAHFLTNEQLVEVLSLSKIATAIHVGEDAVIQTANEAMLNIWGKDKSVIGKSLEDALPELRGQPFIDLFKKVWNEGLTISGTDTAADLELNGTVQTFYFDFEYRAVKNADGPTTCILHTAIDVTERFLKKEAIERAREKEAALEREQALNEELAAANEELRATNEELQKVQEQLRDLNEESREQLQFAVNAAGLGTFDLDPVTNRFSCNQRLKDWFGISVANNIELSVATNVIAEADRERIINAIQTAMHYTSRGIYNTEFTIINPEYLHNRIVKAKGQVLFNELEQPVRFSGTVQDITDEKNAVKELEQTQNMLRMAIDAAKIGSWFIKPDTKALQYNDTLAEIFGYKGKQAMTYEQAIGQVTENYREKIVKEIEKAITEGGNYEITYTQKRFNDNAIIWLRSLGKISQDESGQYTIFSGVVMDITEQKKDEQRKNDFIGMVSHELKTPLTTLNAYLQMLQVKAKKADDKLIMGALDKSVNQVKKMTTMINGFLNVSRLESGKIHIVKQTFLLDELVREMIEETSAIQSSHFIQFTTGKSVEIIADRDKIGSVISNLLSNAIKYSPKGSQIEVSCKITGRWARVSVKDEGIGIKQEDTEKLFDRYYRVENENNIAGFGIGLYLSAEIIQRHNGRIWVESMEGKGATFFFNLPLAS